MKQAAGIPLAILLGLIFVSAGFSQERAVSQCLSFLGKVVPGGFSRMNRTTYSGFIIDDSGDEHQVQLLVSNDIVYAVVYGAITEYTHEAREWLSPFYNYFEDNNWLFSEEESFIEEDVYTKDDDYVMIPKIFKREDGMIVAMVFFSKIEYREIF